MAGIIDLVGNTPLVEIRKLNPNPNVKMYAKLEGNNPGGSVKDRPALNMIRSALERGDIKPGTRLIEATSGNTGIALAMIARLYDLEIELVMPSSSTRERTLTMEAFGAKVTLLDSIEICRDYAEEKAATGEYYILNQFANPDNYLAHYKTTGPEIWNDTRQTITHFVSSMGTTGTIMGVSRYLKEKILLYRLSVVSPPKIHLFPVSVAGRKNIYLKFSNPSALTASSTCRRKRPRKWRANWPTWKACLRA